ncbi:MAG: hypothetical protein WAU58_18475 [Terriglobales bacterium]
MKDKPETERRLGYGQTAGTLLSELEELARDNSGAAVVLHFYRQYAMLVFHDEEGRREKLTRLLTGIVLPVGFIAWNRSDDTALFTLRPLPEYAKDKGAGLYLTQVLESILPKLPGFFAVHQPEDSIFTLSVEQRARLSPQH